MAGYNPAGLPPADWLVDPTVRKTFAEWTEIFYPQRHQKPWWLWIAKGLIKCGFAVDDGKLKYDPSYYRRKSL